MYCMHILQKCIICIFLRRRTVRSSRLALYQSCAARHAALHASLSHDIHRRRSVAIFICWVCKCRASCTLQHDHRAVEPAYKWNFLLQFLAPTGLCKFKPQMVMQYRSHCCTAHHLIQLLAYEISSMQVLCNFSPEKLPRPPSLCA